MHGTCQFPVWIPNPLSISVFNCLQQQYQRSPYPAPPPTDANPTYGMEILYSPAQIPAPTGYLSREPQGYSCGDSRPAVRSSKARRILRRSHQTLALDSPRRPSSLGKAPTRRKIRRPPADRTSVSHKSLFAAAVPRALNLNADEAAHRYARKARRFPQLAQKFTRNTNCHSVTHLQIP
jgi:hypothetical protein